MRPAKELCNKEEGGSEGPSYGRVLDINTEKGVTIHQIHTLVHLNFGPQVQAPSTLEGINIILPFRKDPPGMIFGL